MRTNTQSLFFLTALALVFTAGLTFASIELPRLLDAFLGENIDTVDAATGLNQLSEYKTELYLQYFYLRPIGYFCLAAVVLLIIVGFLTEKTGWASAGALILFLPVFGHFAATMFFLGGLGFLRLIWLPALDASFTLFRLGEIINVPHEILVYIASLVGLSPGSYLSCSIIGLGLLIFILGTLTWFLARTQKKDVADFWVYRHSRHPQYLGWIIWSYGVMYLPGPNIRLCYSLSNSLPWLLSTMIIIGVAMLEELKMKRLYGESYEPYRKRAPFLVPLPRFLAAAFTLPLRLMFKKDHPERKREILAVLSFYTCLCLGGSVFYGGFIRLSHRETESSPQQVEDLARIVKEANHFGEKRRAADELERIGEPAIGPLIALLNDDVPQVRAYAAGALGGIGSERATVPLIALLLDRDSYVRRTAARALGRIGSVDAIQPLVNALRDQDRALARTAALGLGNINHPTVIPPLLEALRDTTLKITREAAIALGNLGAREAVKPLVRCYEEQPDCPYDVVGTALWKLGSERAIDAWITGLKRGSWWLRRAACATALGGSRSEAGIPALEEAVNDTSKEVRRAAVLAMASFQSEKAAGALLRALMDSDFEVRMYAEEALRNVRTKGN